MDPALKSLGYTRLPENGTTTENPFMAEELATGPEPLLNMTLKIGSFSLLHTQGPMFMSPPFQSGGYAWKFLLYLNGPPTNCLSFGLIIVGDRFGSALPVGWKVDAKFNIYLFNHVNRSFIKIAENRGWAIRFQFQKLLTLASASLLLSVLTNISNGFLHNDECIFGVKVLVCDDITCARNYLSTLNGVTGTYTWKIKRFPKTFLKLQKDGALFSPRFKVGKYKCSIMCTTVTRSNPALGDGLVKTNRMPSCGNNIPDITMTENRFFSIFIRFQCSCLEDVEKWSETVNTMARIRVIDQSKTEEHIVREGDVILFFFDFLVCNELNCYFLFNVENLNYCVPPPPRPCLYGLGG
ncbi:hypothetical protein AQUCO_01600186v1 [Aquilegia coerulea]|uniref:MATH domain-containing protein n=1 Tax=Aquilegia coerulea TaxID=218851 RepID=A0A2G5DQH3_AQUCA|nr:hypothetical protein AQUCO_01600186v1 [Aquilegia coerulea]